MNIRRTIAMGGAPTVGTQTVDTTERLEALRRYMALPEYNIDAIVIPSEDQRSSYFPHHLSPSYIDN